MIQVWNKNLITSDVMVGEGAFSLTSVRKGNSKPVEMVVPLFEKGQKAGTVTVSILFTLHDTGRELDYVKAPDTNGKFKVEPKEATLLKDINLIATMDPLVIVRFGNETASSAVSTDGGKKPHWIDELMFTREVIEDTLYVELWNFSDLGSNDFLGIGYCSITEALNLMEK